MAIKGGDIAKFTYAGREFAPSGDADVTIFLHGKDLTNTAAGNGTMVTLSKRRLGGFDGLALVLDSARKDQEFLTNIQSSGVPKPWTLEEAGGIVYSGIGLPEGEGLGKSTATGQYTLAVRGERAEQI